ncbi:hypothetical protein [Microcoleus sp. FACHB-672]|uniref:hypothetical protein n=1 Tax=Microcoleus sp. FACHB-672 TaxID=2692825 RepID=UPI0016839333|nr:hypothetical protein [Microcoleus sp. FACHB-672]MBD2040351.1 hypothetical protein [Microcoleus sp. FACHB-672]
MNACPCCSNQLLRHARNNGVYWFCSHCWQEMPDLSSMVAQRNQRVQQLERLICSATPAKKELAEIKVAEVA